MKQSRLMPPLAGKEKIPMPMYYFDLRDSDIINDIDGTELADIEAAREHADTVARELTFKSSGFLNESWSMWSMHVHDGDGLELFSFEMSDVKSQDNGA
jgi:hypothetical protein